MLCSGHQERPSPVLAGGEFRTSTRREVESTPPPARVRMSIHPEDKSYSDHGLSVCSERPWCAQPRGGGGGGGGGAGGGDVRMVLRHAWQEVTHNKRKVGPARLLPATTFHTI